MPADFSGPVISERYLKRVCSVRLGSTGECTGMRGYDCDTYVRLFLPVSKYRRQVKGARPGRHGLGIVNIGRVWYDCSSPDGRVDCYI